MRLTKADWGVVLAADLVKRAQAERAARAACYCGQPSSTSDKVGNGLCAKCAVAAALRSIGNPVL